MGKLIKYELKENFKLFIGMFFIASLLDIFLLLKIGSWTEPAITGFMILIGILLFAVVLIFIEKSFSNELYEDRGYLTFTLPVSCYKILGAKLIVGVIWFIVSGFLNFIFFRILIAHLVEDDVFSMIISNSKQIFLLVTISIIIKLIMLLVMIYFSVTLTKVAYKGKKVSGFIAFLTFIILNLVICYIYNKIDHVFPQQLAIPLKLPNIANEHMVMNGVRIESFKINISRVIYHIIIFIGLFFGTGYLIEKKIDI